jgi:hypothetical protein
MLTKLGLALLLLAFSAEVVATQRETKQALREQSSFEKSAAVSREVPIPKQILKLLLGTEAGI